MGDAEVNELSFSMGTNVLIILQINLGMRKLARMPNYQEKKTFQHIIYIQCTKRNPSKMKYTTNLQEKL